MLKTLQSKIKYYISRLPHQLPESMYLKRAYKQHTGERLNLKNPVTFNDKLQWLKLYYRDKQMVQLVDKYGVREFVKDRIGESFLIPLHGVYKHVDEIKLENLPDQFVLKPTHGSGWVIICHDKATFDLEAAKKKLAYWMTLDYSDAHKEWAYKFVPRKIICEQLLKDDTGQVPMDFKFFCADGVPHFCQINMGRFTEHTLDFYDMNWQNQFAGVRPYVNAKKPIPKPASFDRMHEAATKLSHGLPFCRVDLYDTGSQILLGEITLYPTAGHGVYFPATFATTLGDIIKLPKPFNNLKP